ncbi:MAG: hypothetical protein H0U13_15910 [Gemmatimonadaceae bacterium]|nr:hypothetical protein [Gemmatimonadaceae bacterium]
MKYETWENEVLNDPDNDLNLMVRRFLETGERIWYIDRHMCDPGAPELEGTSGWLAACMVALKLLRNWSIVSARVEGTGVLVSRPFLVINDEWLRQDENSPPPHIYVCLAKEEADFKPVQYEDVTRSEKTGDAEIDALFIEGDLLGRVSAVGDDGPVGLWIVERR